MCYPAQSDFIALIEVILSLFIEVKTDLDILCGFSRQWMKLNHHPPSVVQNPIYSVQVDISEHPQIDHPESCICNQVYCLTLSASCQKLCFITMYYNSCMLFYQFVLCVTNSDRFMSHQGKFSHFFHPYEGLVRPISISVNSC